MSTTTEPMFVDFVDTHADEIKALARLQGMTDADKAALIRTFQARLILPGARVEGGTPGTDGHDTGTVQGYWDDPDLADGSPGCVPGAVYVAWDSLISTWDDAAALKPLA